MDFSTAVKWHITWLADILTDVEQNARAMKPEEIARDDLCKIGKWLQDHKEQYGDLNEFAVLEQAHKDLHKSAAKAVQIAQDGQYYEAKSYLSPRGQFVELSTKMLDHAGRLFAKIET